MPLDPEDSSFLCGCAGYADLFFCAKSLPTDRPDRPDIDFATWYQDRWSLLAKATDWVPVAMATLKAGSAPRTVLAVGARGDFAVFRSGSQHPTLGRLPAPPRRNFIATNLVLVERQPFAVGMGRAIARWSEAAGWTRFDPPAPIPQDRACGFNDVVGASAREMVAVGWAGEIWLTDGTQWQQVDSPVSAHLTAAALLPDESVLAVGYDGALVRGRQDRWAAIDSGRTEVLLDVCAFQGEVYVVSAFQILRLAEQGLVPADNFVDADDLPSTCLGLYPAADGSALFSMGPDDLFRLQGGVWERVA